MNSVPLSEAVVRPEQANIYRYLMGSNLSSRNDVIVLSVGLRKLRHREIQYFAKVIQLVSGGAGFELEDVCIRHANESKGRSE